MTYFQSNKSILMIANDSFILGLLNGYCVANNFIFTCLPRSEPLLYANVANSKVKVIIIDLRDLTSALIEAHLEALKKLHNQYGTLVCAIYGGNTKLLCLTRPWVDYFAAENFIGNLDKYINKYINNCTPFFYERRSHDRRSGSDRRALLGVNKSFPFKLLNSKTRLFNKGRDNDILGDFEIDKDSQVVYLKGKNLGLTVKEFKLFNLLAEAPERVCRTEKIISHLWPQGRANKSDLYQYMYLLRRKVELDPSNPRWILTIKGVGYKLYVGKDS